MAISNWNTSQRLICDTCGQAGMLAYPLSMQTQVDKDVKASKIACQCKAGVLRKTAEISVKAEIWPQLEIVKR